MNNNEAGRGLTREQEIAAVIDTRYSIDAQIAILRQKDTKPDEWAAFNAFCEEVKAKIPKRDDETELQEATGEDYA